jgi:hypothetical protein
LDQRYPDDLRLASRCRPCFMGALHLLIISSISYGFVARL